MHVLPTLFKYSRANIHLCLISCSKTLISHILTKCFILTAKLFNVFGDKYLKLLFLTLKILRFNINWPFKLIERVIIYWMINRPLESTGYFMTLLYGTRKCISSLSVNLREVACERPKESGPYVIDSAGLNPGLHRKLKWIAVIFPIFN